MHGQTDGRGWMDEFILFARLLGRSIAARFILGSYCGRGSEKKKRERIRGIPEYCGINVF